MSATTKPPHAQVVYPPQSGAGTYILLTGTAALTAATAAFATLSLGWLPWVMFMGWVAYFTRPSPAGGLQTFVCVVAGLALGALATIAAGALSPAMGPAALPVVVFVVACAVIATRGMPALNNLLGYFIGLITFFAAHQEPGVGSVATLSATISVGFVAGFLSQKVEALFRKQ